MADNVLELLIKLGYVGAENADAAREALAGIKRETGDLSTSLPEGSELWKKYKNVLGEASEGGEQFSLKGREMRKVIGELDKSVPGLGEAFHGLVRGAGPLTVVLMSIQAINAWMDLMKWRTEMATQMAAEGMDKFRDATKKAEEAQWALNESGKKALETVDPYNTALQRQNELEAQKVKNAKDLLLVQEALALAGAGGDKTQEAIIKANFGEAMSKLDSGLAGKKVELLDNVIKSLTGAIGQQEQKIAGLQAELKTAVTAHDVFKIGDVTAKMEAAGRDRDRLIGERSNFQNQAATAADLNAQADAGSRRVDVFKDLAAATAAAKIGASGGELGADAQQLVMRVAQGASGQALNLQQAEQYLQSLEKQPAALKAVLDRLMGYNDTFFNMIQTLAARANSSDARLAQLQAQIDKK